MGDGSARACIVPQVQAGVQLILDTQPAGAKAAGGESKEEVVDKICEDLLARVSFKFAHASRTSPPNASVLADPAHTEHTLQRCMRPAFLCLTQW